MTPKPLSTQHRTPPYRSLLVAALLGGLGVLCFAPFEAFWLAPLIWAAFYHSLNQASDARQAAGRGLAFGLGFFLAGVSWVFVSLSVFGGLPVGLAAPATLLFCATLALYPALLGYTFKRWAPTALRQRVVYFAALVATVDGLREVIFTGFPWLTVGYSQTPPSPLAGFAPLMGVLGLSFLVALSGAALAHGRRYLPAVAALWLLGWGLQSVPWTAPQGRPIRVALIQGNVPQDMKFRPEVLQATLHDYRQLMAEHPAELTVLPETALPLFFDQLPASYRDDLANLARRQQGNVIVGAVSGDTDRYLNSALSLGQDPSQAYHKDHLVPFGEFIPPGFAWFMAQAHIPLASFSRGGSEQPPLQLGKQAVAVNICYEDSFGRDIRRALPAATLLVNLSNTAWFGRSLAQPQHLQIARLRALETGRPMLRATNTGMTAVINPQGAIVAQLPPFTRGVLEAQVSGFTGMTPYAQLGDWPVAALIALGLLPALATAWGRHRQSAFRPK